jgi:ascorbate-specific PTS system EIIC-type component UlaA
MKSCPPLTRVQLIERSLSCLVAGLISLVPVFGLPFAVRAIATYKRVARCKDREWNPAARYLVWGVRCAGFGLLITLLAVLIVFLVVVQSWSD